jgi:hypothetical protein
VHALPYSLKRISSVSGKLRVVHSAQVLSEDGYILRENYEMYVLRNNSGVLALLLALHLQLINTSYLFGQFGKLMQVLPM